MERADENSISVLKYFLRWALCARSVDSQNLNHLRNIARIRSILSFNDTQTIVHAFISSELDLSQQSINGLQTKIKKREQFTPILMTLHWLPIYFRIDFKVVLITFNALYGLAP